jgi:hypothetical protein
MLALNNQAPPMTADDFRHLVLALPEATEKVHMNHPDFRVRGKIFATLGYPRVGWGMVKLTPLQQKRWLKDKPGIFVPAKGAWGARGATTVLLEAVDESTLREAAFEAWSNVAPKSLRDDIEDAD